MSIINDALKKAQEKNKPEAANSSLRAAEDLVTTPEPAKQPASVPAPVKTRRLMPALISLIVVTTGVIFFRSFFGKIAITETTSPFAPAPAAPMPVPKPAPLDAQGFPVLKLNGIVYDTERPYAIVNNKVLSKGDAIEGATLTEIEQEKVKLVFNGREFELSSK